MNTIITIGRQFGSGGREIGEKVAEHFGIKCYDKELLAIAAKNSGLSEELLKNHDERPTNSFLYSLVMDTYSMGYSTSTYMDMPLNQKVFLAQYDTIKELAEETLRQLPESQSKLVYRPLPSDDPKRRKPDITLAKELLGWEPKVPLQDGLAKTIAYFRELTV